jgi:hypothetical protein
LENKAAGKFKKILGIAGYMLAMYKRTEIENKCNIMLQKI